MTAAPQSFQQISQSAPRGMGALHRYVEMRRKMPLSGLGDSVHHIHASTEFEAELRFSDLEAIIASGDVRAAVIEDLRTALIEARQWVEGSTANVRGLSAQAAAPGEAMLAKIDRALSQSPATDAAGGSNG